VRINLAPTLGEKFESLAGYAKEVFLQEFANCIKFLELSRKIPTIRAATTLRELLASKVSMISKKNHLPKSLARVRL